VSGRCLGGRGEARGVRQGSNFLCLFGICKLNYEIREITIGVLNGYIEDSFFYPYF